MSEWKNIKVDGIVEIKKCVGEYSIFHDGRLPLLNFRVKIFEYPDGSYVGFYNFRIRNPRDGSFDAGASFGKTEAECLEETLKYLLNSISELDKLTSEDIEWTEDF